jgi:ABC-type xylose transport system permease subunit
MLLGAAQADANGFITPRNLWNLSVQTSYIGIMATGMVLVIITRNIDLSVGSIMGMVGMYMGLLQVEWLAPALGMGHPSIWIITVIFGIAMGTLIGAFQGVLIAFLGIPSFIVTLGGLLVWRGAAFLVAGGKTIAPLDDTFSLIGRIVRVARHDRQLDFCLDCLRLCRPRLRQRPQGAQAARVCHAPGLGRNICHRSGLLGHHRGNSRRQLLHLAARQHHQILRRAWAGTARLRRVE